MNVEGNLRIALFAEISAQNFPLNRGMSCIDLLITLLVMRQEYPKLCSVF
jgi:hypothetical protein